MNKIKTIFYQCLIFLVFSANLVHSQTPQVHLNSGLQTTGVTGTITITCSSVSATYTGSFTYNPSQPIASQTLFLNSLPVANDYKIKISNNTNKALSYFICQAERTCDPNSSRYSSCQSLDNTVIDGTTVAIPSGINNYLVAQNFKIIANAQNGTDCVVNAGANANYVTGAIYINLFGTYTNSLLLQPITYTDRVLYIRNSSCATKSSMHIFVNGIELTNYTVNVAVFGLFYIQYPFGAIKAGDVVHVTNDCGDSPSPYRIVSDVNYFIEVPNGVNYTGNGITSTDSLPPSGRLDTPVEVKQCTEIPVNAHFNANFNFVPFKNNDGSIANTGIYKINGNPITENDLTIVPESPLNGGSITINNNGSISSQYDNFYISNRKPGIANPKYTFEYIHNGIDESEKTFNINQVGYAFIENSTYRTFKYNYGDHPNHIYPSPSSTSSYKLEFTGNKVRWLVNNTKIDSVTYTVQYSIVKGNGTLSNTNAVEVGTPITFIPADTGSYALQAEFSNGVIIQQKFHTTANVPVIAPSLATIYSGNQISLVASGCSGTIHWGSPTSTTTGNVYQVSPLITTTYTAYCENTSGCTTSGKSVTVTVQAPKPTITPNAASVCAGVGVTLTATGCVGGTYSWTGGLTGNSISVNPSATTIYNATCNNAAGTSLPTPIKLTVN